MLNDKKILIVGGSSGIGFAVASLAQKNGANVVIASRNPKERAASFFEKADESTEIHTFDITIPEDHFRLFESTGIVDHLVITVRPVIKSSPFQKIDVNEAKHAFETKFWGQYQLIQVAQKHLRESGSIILTSGIAGEKIFKGASTMSIINCCIETLCRVLSVELAPIRINVVSPGFIEPKPTVIEEISKQFPAKRLGSVDEIASAYLWLMGSQYTTGTVTVIDGGARHI
ncbi:SDR family oxidoreductase [Desulfotignum balticum]|uniref:SDR family oxidoreductase n=1 Tax=Desulfotignum balticum TaxID=115781 RepID=UPI000400480C|nr:SDR family oxidoreductase [Desulfotignum balticum]